MSIGLENHRRSHRKECRHSFLTSDSAHPSRVFSVAAVPGFGLVAPI
jgi:hypothetical protein